MNDFIDSEFNTGLVSVIIPTHNRGHLIAETIESVFDQTYRHFEILVVDDDSSDNTEEIVSQIQDNYQNVPIRYTKIEKSNPSIARNAGLQISCGEYIQFLDSDDILLSSKFEEQVRYLREHPDAGAVYSYSRSFLNNDRARLGAWLCHDPKDKLKFVMRSWAVLFHTEAALWRRSGVCENGLWDHLISYGDDWEYLARFLIKGGRLDCMRKIHSLYRLHEQNMTNMKFGREYAVGHVHMCEKIYPMIVGLEQGKYLVDFSEKIWVLWSRLVSSGYPEMAEKLWRLLEKIESQGSLCSIARFATGGINSPNMERNRKVRSFYIYWKKFNRLRSLRLWPRVW